MVAIEAARAIGLWSNDSIDWDSDIDANGPMPYEDTRRCSDRRITDQ